MYYVVALLTKCESKGKARGLKFLIRYDFSGGINERTECDGGKGQRFVEGLL